MIEPLAVATHGVMGLDLKSGDAVAVFGLGTIGITIQVVAINWYKNYSIDIDSNKINEAKSTA